MSMSTYPITVTGIAETTSKEHLHDFFTFCGTIKEIDYKSDAHSAIISFERVSAAKTALMLNGGALDGATLSVTSDVVRPDEPHPDEATPVASGSGEHHIHQEDKPRSGIAAEYLAKGYTLSDSVLQKAIEMDQKNGISQKFLSYLSALDQKIGSKLGGPEPTLSEKVINTAKSVDEKQGITRQASTYYEKALGSPVGQQVWSFYSSTSKQIFDIHEEARRLADEKKHAAAPPPTAAADLPPTGPASTSTAPVGPA